MAVDLQLLRSLLLPETRIFPGRALMARVVSADGRGRGSLSIAGLVIDAELPRQVRGGQDLRLIVREVSSERVLLTLADPGAAAAAGAPAPPPVPLPGGGTVQVIERDPGEGAGAPGGSQTLTLRYDAPALGAVDLRFELSPGGLRVGVSVGAGPSLALARGASRSLQEALAAAVKGPVTVAVSPRHDPLEIYA